MTRYFRANVLVYESVASQLDAAYGYPNAETKTLRAIPLASDLPQDLDGRVCLAISSEYCEYALPSEMLLQLLSGGYVEEITEAEYLGVMQHP